MPGGFDEQPATKRDLAGVKQELRGDIVRLEGEIHDLRQVVEKGFLDVSKLLLEGPPGLVKRVDRIEERVGLR